MISKNSMFKIAKNIQDSYNSNHISVCKEEKQSMNLLEKLNTLLTSDQEATNYHQMLRALTDEIKDKTEKIYAMKYKNQGMIAEWEAFVENYIAIMNEWGNSDLIWIKKKKLYEEMEPLMAEIDDWIDEVNEAVLNDEEQLKYIEKWDIGIFFE